MKRPPMDSDTTLAHNNGFLKAGILIKRKSYGNCCHYEIFSAELSTIFETFSVCTLAAVFPWRCFKTGRNDLRRSECFIQVPKGALHRIVRQRMIRRLEIVPLPKGNEHRQRKTSTLIHQVGVGNIVNASDA